MGPHSLVAIWKRNIPEDIFDAIGSLRLGFINVLTDSEQEVGLADIFIANDDDFVEVVK